MKLSRDVTSIIRKIVDECLPPQIRDTVWFMVIPMYILFGKSAPIFFSFKEKAFLMTLEEYAEIYRKVNPLFSRETDLNAGCIDAITHSIQGTTVLEVGCGRGYLIKKLKDSYKVTVADIAVDERVRTIKGIKIYDAAMEKLPFKDRSFDTVICTHTVEHVLHFHQAISELRRVAKKRLILVIPKQKPYRYTFDLHLHFFPYAWTVLSKLDAKVQQSYLLKEINGDWFYYEDYQKLQRSK